MQPKYQVILDQFLIFRLHSLISFSLILGFWRLTYCCRQFYFNITISPLHIIPHAFASSVRFVFQLMLCELTEISRKILITDKVRKLPITILYITYNDSMESRFRTFITKESKTNINPPQIIKFPKRPRK